MREMTSEEIDAMLAAISQAIEGFRDARNPALKLVPKNHGEQCYSCHLEGLLVADDLGKIDRTCRRIVPGSKIALESFADGTACITLNLPIHVQDVDHGSTTVAYNSMTSSIQKPSNDRAMLLLVLLIILLAWLWARL